MTPTLSYVQLANRMAKVTCVCGWETESFLRGPFDPMEALVAHGIDHLVCDENQPKKSNLGKAELKLAYKSGALSIINRRDMEKLIDPETKERMEKALEAEFEEWCKAMGPIFAMSGRTA